METEARISLVLLLDGDLVDSPEHLGVALLTAQLRNAGFAVRIFEVTPGGDDEICREIAEFGPCLVGISLTTVNLPRARAFGAQLRARLGDEAQILLGGPIATFRGAELLDLPGWQFADAVFRGEADEAIVAIARRAAGRDGDAASPIAGYYARGAPPPVVPVVAVRDIGTLPWPARDQLAANPRLPYVRVSTTRGCTSACSFCNAPHAGNNLARAKLWRQRAPQCVVDELADLVERYQVDTFDFVDSTFEDPSGSAIGKARVAEIADLILARGLRIYFNICCQAINWHVEDRPLIARLHAAGLEKVLIGVESGHEGALRRYGKRANVADNRRAIALFRERGIYVAFGYIMFDPMGDFEELEANAAFLHANIGHNFRRYLTRLELYPGAAAIGMLEREGLLDPGYRDTLNPYAYRYRDPRIGRLAADMARIVSETYVHEGSALAESPVVAFETFSIQTHTLFSRLRRFYDDAHPLSGLIAEGEAEVARIYAALAADNHALFMDALARAQRGMAPRDGYVEQTNARYRAALDALHTAKMRTSLRLRRAGGTIALVQGRRAEPVPA